MESAPIQSEALADSRAAATPPPRTAIPDHAGLLPSSFEELWELASASSFDLSKSDFADILQRVGTKVNFGLPSDQAPSLRQKETFFRALHLRELALAQACALGRNAAWEQFVAEFREPITRAAVAITGSSSLGQDLADSLYSELFGLPERNGERKSPLASYSGRGSLMGWLRTTLAQRHVDRHRRTHRESPIEDQDFAAKETAASTPQETLDKLQAALRVTLRDLEAEERFMLASWFLDGRTLLQIARLLRVHEATISRKLKRLTVSLRKDLLKQLQAEGMSKRAAEEALGADPRDIELNLRKLLQSSPPPTFQEQESGPDRGQT